MCLCLSTDRMSADDMKGKYGKMYGPYADKEATFQITMCQAPCEDPGCYCASLFCCCFALMKMRYKALNHVNPGSGWSDYKCCQGYIEGCCCLQPGQCGESSCPIPCAFLETFCCAGPAVSSTSMLIRDRYNLGLDSGDIRLIHCNNCLFYTACICQCLSLIFDWEGEELCVSTINCISDVVFCCTSACMTAQVNYEIEYREKNNAPIAQGMVRE